jgi:hypothetical protein
MPSNTPAPTPSTGSTDALAPTVLGSERRLDVYQFRRGIVAGSCLLAGAGVLWTQLGSELHQMLGR